MAAGALVVLERLRPLRARREPEAEHLARNAAIGLLAAATTAAGSAALAPVQRWAETRRVGLLRVLPLPRVLRLVLGFLLLDYTLFLWHWANHRADVLWRFHAVHHSDRDLDVSTGIRFHFGELALSVGLRAAQIVLLGVDRVAVDAWQRLLFASVLFHHSNLALAPADDELLSVLFVTPRLHGIHHSTNPSEADTNYSSLLSCWDRVHDTWLSGVPEQSMEMGVEGLADGLSLERALTLPFGEGTGKTKGLRAKSARAE